MVALSKVIGVDMVETVGFWVLLKVNPLGFCDGLDVSGLRENLKMVPRFWFKPLERRSWY